MNTYFVCNVVTGDVFEIMESSRNRTDEYCKRKMEERANARGRECTYFLVPGRVGYGDIAEIASAIARWGRYLEIDPNQPNKDLGISTDVDGFMRKAARDVEMAILGK